VADALSPHCAALVVCGRNWPGLDAIADRPTAGLGPLGGLCAALHHGHQQGFESVLAAPCDLLIPAGVDLSALLPGPAVAEGQWLLGAWPTRLCDNLQHWLQDGGARAVHAYAGAVEARTVALAGLVNVNRPQDLPDAR
jgi:molybdopterin-guanine dinucleotide biosynthesis protein A